MKVLSVISFVLLLFCGKAQEVRLGMTIGTSPAEYTSLNIAQHSPANSYYTYVESSQGEGLIRTVKVFNSANIGVVINFSYRRFAFNMEPQFFYKRGIYTFREPAEIRRIMGAKAFRMPMYFTYKFFKKENSAYLLLGWNITKESNWDFQHPGDGFYLSDQPPYAQTPDFGDDHFQGVMYDGMSYSSVILGLGKQFKKFNMSIRFQRNSNKFESRLPLDTWRTDLTFSWLFLSTKDFTNKHYLYID